LRSAIASTPPSTIAPPIHRRGPTEHDAQQSRQQGRRQQIGRDLRDRMPLHQQVVDAVAEQRGDDRRIRHAHPGLAAGRGDFLQWMRLEQIAGEQERPHADDGRPALLAEKVHAAQAAHQHRAQCQEEGRHQHQQQRGGAVQNGRIEAEHQHTGETQPDGRARAPLKFLAKKPPGEQRRHRHIALHHDGGRGEGGR
jgi:hypothetical protein